VLTADEKRAAEKMKAAMGIVSGPPKPRFNAGALLTATEKAIQSVVSEPKTTTALVLAEIGKGKATSLNGVRSKYVWPGDIFRDGRMIHSHPQLTMAAVLAAGAPLDVATKTLSKLREIETTMRDTLAQAGQFTSAKAHDKFMAQIASLDADTLTDEVKLRSRDAISVQYRANQSAGIKKLVALTEQHVKLSQSILNAAKGRIAAWLETREASERAEADSFGLAFAPSATWQAVVHLAMRVTDARLPGAGQWEFPSRVLAGIVNLESK
jgi:hypothetical protein